MKKEQKEQKTLNSKEILALYRNTIGQKQHRNFMTPKVLKVKAGKKNHESRIVELAIGEGFSSNVIYGVTFRTTEELMTTNKNENNDKCKMFDTYAEAIKHYSKL